jgi:hypothetical protein
MRESVPVWTRGVEAGEAGLDVREGLGQALERGRRTVHGGCRAQPNLEAFANPVDPVWERGGTSGVSGGGL